MDCSVRPFSPASIERTVHSAPSKKLPQKRRCWVIHYSQCELRRDRKSLLQSATEKTPGALPPGTTQRTLAIIMGGGAGTRLFPLTKDRAKPAVPLGGKYRLVDIPISNCLNSGLRSIYVLTQFNSMSLHRHIQASYKFDNFSRSFVDILAAQQTPEGSQWYQGTADAVRQNMRYFLERPFDYYLILQRRPALPDGFSRAAASAHSARRGHHAGHETRDTRSGVRVWHHAERRDRRITRFVEKPTDESVLNELKMSRELLRDIGANEDEELFQASMGIYVFNRNVLIECLENDLVDFGKHIIPTVDQGAARQRLHFQRLLGRHRNDPRILRSQSRSDGSVVPQYSFFEPEAPIYTHPRFLPGSKINGATLRQAIISDGCIISDAHLERASSACAASSKRGATIRNSIVMGADYLRDSTRRIRSADPSPIGIGRNCVIDRAIIDKNARIADGVVITPEGKPARSGRETIISSATASWWCRRTR